LRPGEAFFMKLDGAGSMEFYMFS